MLRYDIMNERGGKRGEGVDMLRRDRSILKFILEGTLFMRGSARLIVDRDMTVDDHDFVWVFHLCLMNEPHQTIPQFSMFRLEGS